MTKEKLRKLRDLRKSFRQVRTGRTSAQYDFLSSSRSQKVELNDTNILLVIFCYLGRTWKHLMEAPRRVFSAEEEAEGCHGRRSLEAVK